MSMTKKSDTPVGTRVTTKGQVTIPKPIRDRLGVRAGDEVIFVEDGGEVRLRRLVRREDIARWRGHLKHLDGRTPEDIVSEMRDG